jgi:hypothetical protein
LKLFYFPDGKMQPGRAAGDEQDFKGAKLEEAQASGVWHDEKTFKKLMAEHQKPSVEGSQAEPSAQEPANPDTKEKS